MKNTKALFLDRDGVINHNFGYVYKIDDFKFIDGIFNLVQAAIKKEYLVIIVTNQAGIGRGYYTESDFFNLMAWVKIKFNENDGQIDDLYFCPFHPDHGIGSYKKNSNLRKPNPGMILNAQKKHNINLSKSIMIGDKYSDMEAGISAGISTNILLTKDSSKAILGNSCHIRNLTEALKYL